MGSRCEVKKLNDVYFISGQLDKTFRAAVDTISITEDMAFNLRDLISINSGGIREWVMLMLKLKNSTLELHECPKVFIDQVNTVKDFVPAAVKIMSFYVPYFNEKSGSEKNVLFKLNHEYTKKNVLPLKKVLDDQGLELDIDVVESKYFKFLIGK